jgi:hypothetical protein
VSRDAQKITFQFDSINNVNGLYAMKLQGRSGPANELIEWNLGTVNCWFREGVKDTTNNHISAEYLPKPHITPSYPPPDPTGIFGVNVAICALLVFAFCKYVLSQKNQTSSVDKLNLSGVILMLVLACALGMLVIFWRGDINLLQFLSLLACSAPFSLFFMHKGVQNSQPIAC